MRLLTAVLLFLFPQVDGGNMASIHEWGTFTSIAAEDGSPVSWRPLYAPSDLPCFVHHLDNGNLKIADFGTVRMETPVLYFYPQKPMALSVRVAFPHGRVTEWYPQASGVQRSDSGDGWIEWRDVQLEKSGEPPATLEPASHYYAARNTDSWSLRSQGEREKLLFYRGIASIGVDLKPVLNSGGVSLLNAGSDPIPAAVVFENHAGKIGFRLIRGLREPG